MIEDLQDSFSRTEHRTADKIHYYLFIRFFLLVLFVMEYYDLRSICPELRVQIGQNITKSTSKKFIKRKPFREQDVGIHIYLFHLKFYNINPLPDDKF